MTVTNELLHEIVDAGETFWGDPEVQEMAAELIAARKSVQTLKILRELMGYVQNGSDETVSLFQDDATMDYMLRVGKKTYWGLSLENVIEKAFEAEGDGT